MPLLTAPQEQVQPVALGCGFFAGIQATTPDMNEMADQHYRETNLMDLQIRSTIGLDEQEVQAVELRYRDLSYL